MTFEEVKGAIGTTGTLVANDSSEALRRAYIHVWSGAVGYEVEVDFDPSGRVFATQEPRYLD